MEQEPLPAQEKYAELVTWLDTTVPVREYYGQPPKQPIRNLFSKLILFREFIEMFITFVKTDSRYKNNSAVTVNNMRTIIDEMEVAYNKRNTASEKEFFKKTWKPMILNLQREYNKNAVLQRFFLDQFGRSLVDEVISFDLNTLRNLETLFSEIIKLNEIVLNQLDITYNRSEEYSNLWRGGRKLTRRRKSNPKSKSKHKHKRRSYKKSSYRRQRR